MSHTLITLDDGDIVKRALAIFHNKLTFLKTINRQFDARFGANGKSGGNLEIRDPVQFTVTTGATLTTTDIVETTQVLARATQKHVALPNFTSLETLNSVEEFEARYLEPAMARLAAEVESDVLNVYKDVWNIQGVDDTTPATMLSILNAGAKLSNFCAPKDNRSLLLNPTSMAACVNNVGAYFHKASEVERGFSEGLMGRAAGMNWFESSMIPNHTNGTRTDTTPVCNTSTGITSGDETITFTGWADGTTCTVGDVFTIADVYAVNPETKVQQSFLQQFVVTALETESGTGDFSPKVRPIPVTSGAKQNVALVSAGASKAVTNLTGTNADGGGSGAASLVWPQNLAYHRDAFTFVMGDLPIVPNQTMTRANMDGLSMRYWKGADIVNDKFPARLDVVYGYKTIRPEWACRVRNSA